MYEIRFHSWNTLSFGWGTYFTLNYIYMWKLDWNENSSVPVAFDHKQIFEQKLFQVARNICSYLL